MSRLDLPAKLAGVVRNYTADFSDQLAAGETISTQTVTASVYSGTDASPSSIISGSASASGSIVTQKITGGVLGVIYELLWQVTTSASQTLQKIGLVAIIPDEP